MKTLPGNASESNGKPDAICEKVLLRIVSWDSQTMINKRTILSAFDVARLTHSWGFVYSVSRSACGPRTERN